MRELTVSAVIPAFNEAEAVGAVIDGVRRALEGKVRAFEVLVVDDGSTDATAEAARRAGATVLAHPVNRGYGLALARGIEAARHDWVLFIDADGSYPTDEIPLLLEHAPAYDLVVGARTGRNFWGTSTQALRRRVYLALAAFVVGEEVPDANSGLRLVRRPMALNTGPVRCHGFSFTTTMTLSFLQAGRFVKYVPVSYEARTGRSKVRPARDILRTLQLMTSVLIAFNPLKLFVTIAAVPAALSALAFLVYLGGGSGAWLDTAALGALAALHCFIAGCVLDALRLGR